MGMDYVVSIKLKPDDEVTGAVKKLLDDVGSGVSKSIEEPTKKARDFVREFRDSFQQIGGAVRGFRNELAFLHNTYNAASNLLGVGARDIVQTAVEWNSEMETMNLSLSTVLSSVDQLDGGQFAGFQKAQQEVARLFGTIVDEAAKTPVEFSDIAQTFTTILPFTRKLVPDLREVVRLSGAISTWDLVGGKRRGDTARDVSQVLSGQFNAQVIQNPLLKGQLPQLKAQYDLVKKALESGKSGIEEQQQLFRMVQKTLSMSEDARTAWEGSFEGMFAALKSEFKLLFTSGSSPVFQQLKEVIGSARSYLEAHPNEVKRMVEEFSRFVFKAASVLYDVFKFFYDHFDTVKAVFWDFIKIWTFVNLTRFVGGLFAFVEVWKAGTLTDFIKAIAGFKTGGLLAGAAGATAGAATSGVGGSVVAGVGAAATGGFLARWLPRIAKGATGLGLVYLLLDLVNDALGVGSPTLSPAEVNAMSENSADWANNQRKAGNDRTRADNRAANAMGFRTSLDAMIGENSGQFLALSRAAQLTEQLIARMEAMQLEQTVNRIKGKENPEVRVILDIQGADATVLSKEGSGARVDVRSPGKSED